MKKLILLLRLTHLLCVPCQRAKIQWGEGGGWGGGGCRWVYTMKESCTGAKTFKARYVAKGYSQVKVLTT